jgi:hypothetical protein
MGGKRYSKTEMEAAYDAGLYDGAHSSCLAVRVMATRGYLDQSDGYRVAKLIETGYAHPAYKESIRTQKAHDPTWHERIAP